MKTLKPTIPSKRNATKIRTKVFAVQLARKQFVKSVAEVRPTEQTVRRAEALVGKVREAKQADFLSKYRVAA